MKAFRNLLIALLTFCSYVECSESLFRHQMSIGPEVYYVKRTREGGSEQDGCLFGARLGYNYIRRYAFYLGCDGLYAEGTLRGEGKDGKKLKSNLSDANLEGRIGYTFESKCCYHPSFTPFFGFGYFWEINKYKHPSPLTVHFHNHFTYIPVGFLSRVFINPCLSIGLNLKARILLEGKTQVKHDAECEDSELTYEEMPHYRVEVPISYYFDWCDIEMGAILEPFYEYRHYGHRANYPFDFLDTKFRLYGANLRLLFVF